MVGTALQPKGVKTIDSTYYAFAAVLRDGTVEAWGSEGNLLSLTDDNTNA